MPTWKLTLEYDGTRYRGWQAQANTDRTVQGVLLRAVREVLGADATAGGAGRTDAGVHALAQVAHVRARKKASPGDIVRGVNDLLPHDVNILSAEPAAPTFHARHENRISIGKPSDDLVFVAQIGFEGSDAIGDALVVDVGDPRGIRLARLANEMRAHRAAVSSARNCWRSTSMGTRF